MTGTDTATAQETTARETIEPEALIRMLQEKFAHGISSIERSSGDVVIGIPRLGMLEFFRQIRDDHDLAFKMLSSVTCVDWMDSRDSRFEMVYHVYSFSNNLRLRIKIGCPERDAEVESLVPLWSSANFMEREVFDMYGVRFRGHPDLRRILMYPEFVGHPLRKDYPLQAKQPRVPLRSPEVSNTARDMHRSALVQINPAKKQMVDSDRNSQQ